MLALVLGHRLDPTANAVAAALDRRGGCQVVRRDITGLAAARWQHRLAADGSVTTQVDSDGIAIGAPDVVFNRLGPVQALAFRGWSAVDRGYGQAEWLALLVSWLSALGRRVVGAPSGSDLCGPADRPWLWQAAAAAAGLGVHPAGATTSPRLLPAPRGAVAQAGLVAPMPPGLADPPTGYAAAVTATCDLLVIGDAVHGAIDPGAATRAACLALSAARSTPVLALTLAQAGSGPWRFVAADPAPLVTDGAPLHALAALIAARAA
ncbi:hypothetical protein [Sandarakinorhabdus sp. DWP1-3-1]|uniref:hypothetical protein n=1 Tax=Sandarakinorhabdus sp. DWP1-3-1 TaxID=2804627 RepID=UPI003CE83E6C